MDIALTPHQADPPETSSKRSAATLLVDLALSLYDLGVGEDREPFAVEPGGHIIRSLRGDGQSLRADLAQQYFKQHGSAPSQQALTDALLVLEGQARQAAPVPVHLRTARTPDGTVWVDLGDQARSVIRVGHAGWDVVPDSPVLFRRNALTGAMPTPDQASPNLAALWTHANIDRRDRPLVLALLVQALLPDVPHPVAVLLAEQGSGKSTATRRLASLIDPSTVQLRKPPRDVDQWVTAAAGSHVGALDNLSGLPDWLSDTLCRASTGDGDVRRRLYSDSGLTVFAFRRVVLLNGIDLGALRDDLADRTVTLNLRPMGGERRTEHDLDAAWQTDHPRILAGLLDLAAAVLLALPEVRLSDAPRMIDFARVLAATDQQLGTDGLTRYRQQAGDLAADAVSSDPVLTALAERVAEPWTGTAAELLARLPVPEMAGRDWPRTPRALTGLLRRRAPSLRRMGWDVDDLGRSGRDKVVRFYLAPPPAGDETGSSRRGRAAGDSAGDAGDSAGSAGDAAPVARTKNRHLTRENAEIAENAGDAGDRNGPYLLEEMMKEEEAEQERWPVLDARNARNARTPTALRGRPDLAAAASRPEVGGGLGLGQRPGRCHACEHHIATQGHRQGCPERAAS